MANKKILLLYISEDSGHHCASLSIERALHALEPDVKTLNINSFNYTNPILERIINTTYMSVIKRTPEIWEYLYDNPKVMKSVHRLRDIIHRSNTGKLKSLLDEFKPDGIICTQAFPCGLIADYKKTFDVNIPLIGVLTDYAPHSYWIFDKVDRYIVPSMETGKKLIDNGVDPDRVMPYGIPIDAKFQHSPNKEEIFKAMSLEPNVATALIMGGTQGLGPIKELVSLLDRSLLPLQMIIACGTNKRLFRWLSQRRRNFKKKTVILSFAGNIDELMHISTVIVTKPGGITTAEALTRGLPMLIVNPLPGQEAMNTKFLLNEGVAVRAQNPVDVVVVLEELLYNKNKLKIMSDKAKSLSKPDSAGSIARLMLEIAK
jgi:processive 1,2-diacylglycerol beta-glucosyltransferase